MKVVGFGEILGAIRPIGFAAWGDCNEMVILAGGSEANVLAKVGGLAQGIETQFISKMKNDLMGRLLRYDMQRYRIGMDHVVWTTNDRNGLCFVEQGLGPITAEGGYDRAGSALARAEVGEFDLTVLSGADAFFTSGITMALSESCLANTELALAAAKREGVPVFLDVNYRNKLWSPSEAQAALSRVVDRELLTCLVTTETDARVVFGVDRGFDDDRPMDELIACCTDILHGLDDAFAGKVPILVMTIRKRITNERGEWSTVALIDGKKVVVGDRFDYVVLDRYGAGDSCSAGIIGGYLGVCPDGTVNTLLPVESRIQNGLNLGNRMAVVAQKTVSDLGPQWPAAEYFGRVGKAREITR
jgi:2-dehydro-3-deoxygluconokinase